MEVWVGITVGALATVIGSFLGAYWTGKEQRKIMKTEQEQKNKKAKVMIRAVLDAVYQLHNKRSKSQDVSVELERWADIGREILMHSDNIQMLYDYLGIIEVCRLKYFSMDKFDSAIGLRLDLTKFANDHLEGIEAHWHRV